MISDNNRFILGSRRLKEFAARLETQAAQSASQKSNTHNKIIFNQPFIFLLQTGEKQIPSLEAIFHRLQYVIDGDELIQYELKTLLM